MICLKVKTFKAHFLFSYTNKVNVTENAVNSLRRRKSACLVEFNCWDCETEMSYSDIDFVEVKRRSNPFHFKWKGLIGRVMIVVYLVLSKSTEHAWSIYRYIIAKMFVLLGILWYNICLLMLLRDISNILFLFFLFLIQ